MVVHSAHLDNNLEQKKKEENGKLSNEEKLIPDRKKNLYQMPLTIHHIPLIDASVPLTRSLISVGDGSRKTVTNLDDFTTASQWRELLRLPEEASVSSKGVSVEAKVLRQCLTGETAVPLPKPLSSRKPKYSDSRKLEAATEAFLHDFVVARAARLAQAPEVDEEGFVTVKHGFKPEDAVKTAAKEDEKLCMDFYRFQHKDRKLTEWRQEQIKQEHAVEEVDRLKKKRRFNL
jgi:hypothetical protein